MRKSIKALPGYCTQTNTPAEEKSSEAVSREEDRKLVYG